MGKATLDRKAIARGFDICHKPDGEKWTRARDIKGQAERVDFPYKERDTGREPKHQDTRSNVRKIHSHIPLPCHSVSFNHGLRTP